MRFCFALLIVGTTWSLGYVQTPAQPKPDKKPRVDAYGDPLPEGAVARLGTVRFKHEGMHGSLALSPDGKILVGSSFRVSIVWDAETGKEIYRLEGVNPEISPDGNMLAVAELWPTKISLRDLRSGKHLRDFDLPEPMSPEHALMRFSRDGKSIAYVFNNDTTIIDAHSGKKIAFFESKKAAIYDLAFSPDGKMLAIASSRPGVQIWDITTATMRLGIDDHGGFVHAVAFSPDGKSIASTSLNQLILSDITTGQQISVFESGKISSRGLHFTPNGKSLVTGYRDGVVRVWEVAKCEVRHALNGRTGMVQSLAMSADGKLLAAGTNGNTIRLWQASTGKELFTDFKGHDSPANALVFSKDGRSLYAGGDYGPIRRWSLSTHTEEESLPSKSNSLSLSPDGKRLATIAAGKTVRVFEVNEGKESLSIKGPENSNLQGVAFSFDGSKLFALDWPLMSPHAELRQWDAVTGKEDGARKYSQARGHLVLASDQRTIFSTLANGNIVAIEARTGRDRLLKAMDKESADSLALSNDARILAVGISHNWPDANGKILAKAAAEDTVSVRLWETSSGKELLKLKGSKLVLDIMAWSPDGRILAAGDNRGLPPMDVKDSPSIRLWDAAAGMPIAVFGGLKADVSSLAFSPDGITLAAGLMDTTILVWKVPQPNELPSTSDIRIPELQDCWDKLADDDAAHAYKAAWKLIAAKQNAVAFLKGLLKPRALTDPAKVQNWIADLGSDKFGVREAAAKALEQVGQQVMPAIEKTLQANVPPETRRRLESLLIKLEAVPGPEALRVMRAVMVLERIRTSEARSVLETLATGAPFARETEEAKTALARLMKGAN